MFGKASENTLKIPLESALASEGEVVSALRSAFANVLAIYAFGSRVNGMARDDSDLDLAILVAGYAEPLRLWGAADQLSEALGCPVDLLDFRAASTVMQFQVLTQGRRLWASEPMAGLFECFVLTEKNRLDEDRAGLITDIEKSGRVYG